MLWFLKCEHARLGTCDYIYTCKYRIYKRQQQDLKFFIYLKKKKNLSQENTHNKHNKQSIYYMESVLEISRNGNLKGLENRKLFSNFASDINEVYYHGQIIHSFGS